VAKRDAELEQKLSKTVERYVSIANRGEDARKRDDKIGANLWLGHHYVGVMPSRDRPMITANIFKALIHHKASIMVKQLPIPVVEATDAGDAEAAEHLRNLLMHIFKNDDMMLKTRKAVIVSNVMRTCALKVVWDDTLRGGVGDVTTDLIMPWNLILDTQVSSYDRMSFCGDRTVMPRSKAMTMYPKAAEELEEPDASGGQSVKFFGSSDSPIKDPWGKGTAGDLRGAPTSVNSKPVFAVFAGEIGFASDKDDLVEICEVYHRDLTLYETEQVKRDERGNEEYEYVKDETGELQFDQIESQFHHDQETGWLLEIPQFVIRKEQVVELVRKRKYPEWRRTTAIFPDGKVIEDIAWDGPLPYAFMSDDEPLSGVWWRGSGLQLETLQAMMNVSLSTMVHNLRMGSLQAFKVSPSAGIQGQALTLKPGQLVYCDPKQMEAIQVPQLSPEWFNWINNLMGLMERVVGAQGIMQGEAAGRVDSAAGYDLLAEIGGSRIVECTQRMEKTLAEWAQIVSWFAQNYYTEKHAIAVEDNEGKQSYERAYGPLLNTVSPLRFGIEVGSSMAWSESAKRQRDLELFKAGVIDRVELYKRMGLANWKPMLERIKEEMAAGQPWMAGGAGSPPPRTRQTVPKAKPTSNGKR
jgi:hypothetical protein